VSVARRATGFLAKCSTCTSEQTRPSTVTQLFEQAGDATEWWGAIAAFLVDSYRARSAVQWEARASAWGEVYRKGARAIVYVVPRNGYLLVLIPFATSAVRRAAENPSLLDVTARVALGNYLAAVTPVPTVCVRSDEDADAVMRLVSVAHPRKGHPCGSL
jgi:hypothetical protein